MTIGLLQLDYRFAGARSLKDKRRVLNSIKQTMHNKFNCSVAEVDFKDLWNRARLAVCVVSDDAAHANDQVNEIAKFASSRFDAELLDYTIEMI